MLMCPQFLSGEEGKGGKIEKNQGRTNERGGKKKGRKDRTERMEKRGTRGRMKKRWT